MPCRECKCEFTSTKFNPECYEEKDHGPCKTCGCSSNHKKEKVSTVADEKDLTNHLNRLELENNMPITPPTVTQQKRETRGPLLEFFKPVHLGESGQGTVTINKVEDAPPGNFSKWFAKLTLNETGKQYVWGIKENSANHQILYANFGLEWEGKQVHVEAMPGILGGTPFVGASESQPGVSKSQPEKQKPKK